MNSPEDVIKLVLAESSQLTSLLDNLDPDAWNMPTACNRWNVGDVVAHLTWYADFYARVITQALRDDTSAPEGFPPAGSANAASFGAINAENAISLRESLRGELLSRFRVTDDQLTRLWNRLQLQDWEKPCYHPIGDIPVRAYVSLRLTELAMHGWDIRSRIQPPARLSEESLPEFMKLVPALVTWSFVPGPMLQAPVRYRFEITGPVHYMSDVVVTRDNASLEPAEESQADVTFHCDTETFVLLMYGRLTPHSAIAADRLTLEGDSRQADKFGSWFKGI